MSEQFYLKACEEGWLNTVLNKQLINELGKVVRQLEAFPGSIK